MSFPLMKPSQVVAVFGLTLAALVVGFASRAAPQNSPSSAASQPSKTPVVAATVPAHEHVEGDAYFSCPMHPRIHSHAPGRCPICKMHLVEKKVTKQDEHRWAAPTEDSSTTPPAKSASRRSTRRKKPQKDTPHVPPQATPPLAKEAAQEEPTHDAEALSTPSVNEEIAYYTCPMHPSVHEDSATDCPICGMSLTPVTKTESETGVVTVDLGRLQEFGIRTDTVKTAPLIKTIRSYGVVVVNESTVVDVTVQTQGWVRRLFADETGQRVAKGEPLARIYSPAVVAAQEELLLALQAVPSSSPSGLRRQRAMVKGARGKLRALGLAKWQVDAIETSRKIRQTYNLVAPASGFVAVKNSVEGTFLPSGARLLQLASLEKAWVEVDVFARDLGSVQLGQTVIVTEPNRVQHEGKVDWIAPTVSRGTQSAKVRVVFEASAPSLRPGMLVDASIRIDLGPRLVVPREAVVFSGTDRIVFVDAGGGRLLPTPVKIGDRSADIIEVTAGLKDGDRVVTSGTFLIAAESRLKSAAPSWGPKSGESTGGTSAVDQKGGHHHGAH